MLRRMLMRASTATLLTLFIVLACLITKEQVDAAVNQIKTGVTNEDPGFTYGPVSRDWIEGRDYYYIENNEIKLTIGSNHLATKDTVDFSDNMSGNNKWGTLTPGHIMDAAPKFSRRDNLDYTEFVLSTNLARTWWYPLEKLNMPDIQVSDNSIVSKGAWDKDSSIKSQVTYSIVENSPLIQMNVKLTNEGTAAFAGHLAYIIDPEESLEQQSYVPGWGWRGGQASAFITSGWNKNYIFNGIQDKYTGNTAHAILWPNNQQPSALIPEGYITGAWFQVKLAPNETKELIIYHLPHNPSPAYESYKTAELWADVIRNDIDPAAIGTILGTVTDAEGKPSPGVDITFQTVTGSTYAATTTDSRGMYSVYTVTDNVYSLSATNGIDRFELDLSDVLTEPKTKIDFTMEAPVQENVTGVTNGDPGFTYEGTSRDWWVSNDYYYMENPDIKFTVGTVRTAGKDPKDWTDNASGNSKWGTLTPGHIMDAVPTLNKQENMDFTEFVLSDDLGVTPEDEANGKYMEWSWFHPLNKLELPQISRTNNSIVAAGDWDKNDKMKSSVRYSIVEGTPLIQMEITLNNQTGADFKGSFGYIVDPDQPGEQHSYLPGQSWVYSQEKSAVKSGWTENYVFSGINNSFTGKTAHAIIWPEDQQPNSVIHEGIWIGAWFDASIPNGQSKTYTLYHLPHIAGPADKPYAAAEFWAKFISEHGEAGNYGSVTGTITTETGEPVTFMEVVLTDSQGNFYGRTVTNGQGKYQLFARKGSYELTPVSGEFSVERKSMQLADTRRVLVDFVVKKYADISISMPSELTVAAPFDISITVKNVTNEALQQLQVEVLPPYFVHLLDEGTVIIPVVEAQSQVEIKVKAAALEGGRSAMQANVSGSQFNITRKGSFDVKGVGYYAGDNHTHTKNSDGVHSTAENANSIYNKSLLSWVWNVEHNLLFKQDADNVTQSYGGRFQSLAGSEVTTSVGHALVYGLEAVPRYDINNSETGYSWQDSINGVTDQGGLFYFAHPFDNKYKLEDPYRWRGFTGIEVWNGTFHALDNGVNERAFKFWDEINIRGDAKYYGFANTDGHTKDKVGDTYSKGLMQSLTSGNVLQLLKTGAYFGSNGPELRFNIDGVDMGGTLHIEGDGNAQLHIQAFDPNSNLSRVRVIKYPVTGSIDDYSRREIVFEEDLSGLFTNTLIKTVTLPVTGKEFYRMEVFSEKANENSSGIGPLTGTGFAFSNPIWIETAGSSNAAAIESISYKNKNKFEVTNKFGVSILEVDDKAMDLKKLEVEVSNGAAVTATSFAELSKGDPSAGLLTIKVTAKDGTQNSFTYLVFVQ
ncbi:CehA/McbA family metallohydrolase [Paenibacillus sp. UNC451MF]|uniref:CehA/McbA family metallohydrolase n=1 Tax=Paenibacillus sp. UNC451MF TaxID=1449063 RepID=UPI000AE53D2D|nr:CehA/McbA family metallohydrolase [Paenibacillus sp. UNC451MF]